MKQIPVSIQKAVLKQRDEFIIQRDKATYQWDIQIKEIEDFLAENGISFDGALFIPELQLPRESDIEASLTRQIKDMGRQMILPGKYVTSDEIYSALAESGARMPPPADGKPRTARITRVLSGTGLYKGHKTKGWSLKGESPVTAGLSSATSS